MYRCFGIVILFFSSVSLLAQDVFRETYRPGLGNSHYVATVLEVKKSYWIGGSREEVPSISSFDKKGGLEWHRTYNKMGKGKVYAIFALPSKNFLIFGESGELDKKKVWSVVVDDEGSPAGEFTNYVTLVPNLYSLNLYSAVVSADKKSYWLSGSYTKRWRGVMSAIALKVDGEGNILKKVYYGLDGKDGVGHTAVVTMDDGITIRTIVNAWKVNTKVGFHYEQIPSNRKTYLMSEDINSGEFTSTVLSENPTARVHLAIPRDDNEFDLVLNYTTPDEVLVVKLIRINASGTRTKSLVVKTSSEEKPAIVCSLGRKDDKKILFSGYHYRGDSFATEVESYEVNTKDAMKLLGVSNFLGLYTDDGGQLFVASTEAGEIVFIKR